MKKDQNNKFGFVNNPDQVDVIEKDDNNQVEVDKAKVQPKKKKKSKLVYVLIALGWMILINGLLFGFGVFWQDDTSLLAIGDAFWLAFFLQLFAGWIMFVYNMNILAPFIHGFKTFGLMIIGKRPKQDYYEYMQNVQNNPIPKKYYILTFLSSLISFIPALTILIIIVGG